MLGCSVAESRISQEGAGEAPRHQYHRQVIPLLAPLTLSYTRHSFISCEGRKQGTPFWRQYATPCLILPLDNAIFHQRRVSLLLGLEVGWWQLGHYRSNNLTARERTGKVEISLLIASSSSKQMRFRCDSQHFHRVTDTGVYNCRPAGHRRHETLLL